jgi:hypothetical protein
LIESGFGSERSSRTGAETGIRAGSGPVCAIRRSFISHQGAYSADTAFLKENVISVEIMSDYNNF